MSLSEKQKHELRGRGHALKPVVTIGSAGLNRAVLRELELSLEHHELMKIKITGTDREARKQIIEQVCDNCQATLIQSVGHVALIYRERKD